VYIGTKVIRTTFQRPDASKSSEQPGIHDSQLAREFQADTPREGPLVPEIAAKTGNFGTQRTGRATNSPPMRL
jgi:hypothetical protein